VRRLLGTVLLALLALAAPAAGAVEKQSYRVDVRAPGELGEAVSIDANAWLPDGRPSAAGRPLVMLFHGGGGTKESGYDGARAQAFAEHGAVAVLYSARGHGDSGGQTTIAGPKEISDLFDMTDDAVRRFAPVDRRRISLWGISQGGLHTNLGQVWADDPQIDPYGLRFAALQPGNTPDRVFDALVDRDLVKLSFGLALIALYQSSTQGQVAPIVDKWIATAAADVPGAYGGEPCDMTGHDTTGSTMKADLAARSFACRFDHWTPPVQWSQAFDDTLFPADMATRSLRAHHRRADRLYLSTGGHGAPASDPGVESDRLAQQVAWLAHVRDGAPLRLPRVTYWLRDPAVAVEYGSARYPPGAWVRRTAGAWPPPGTDLNRRPLGTGSIALPPGEADPQDDPAFTTAAQAIPSGTTLLGALAADPPGGTVAEFRTPPMRADRELVGAPAVTAGWMPAAADSQLVLRVYDEAPDGTLTLLSRGALGVRGATPGEPREVEITAYEFGALIRAGHRVLARISASDATFYKPYPGMAGGTLALDGGALALPLRASAVRVPDGGCVDESAPRPPSLRARTTGGRLRAAGRARDRGCSRLARVEVAVARVRGGRCVWLRAGGGRSAPADCAHPLWTLASGAQRWSHRARAPHGRLRVLARAIDAAGNASRPARRGLRFLRSSGLS
jgi:ABC-2 type transport system ATP-binding protein